MDNAYLISWRKKLSSLPYFDDIQRNQAVFLQIDASEKNRRAEALETQGFWTYTTGQNQATVWKGVEAILWKSPSGLEVELFGELLHTYLVASGLAGKGAALPQEMEVDGICYSYEMTMSNKAQANAGKPYNARDRQRQFLDTPDGRLLCEFFRSAPGWFEPYRKLANVLDAVFSGRSPDAREVETALGQLQMFSRN
jgi:hypothetical protein